MLLPVLIIFTILVVFVILNMTLPFKTFLDMQYSDSLWKTHDFDSIHLTFDDGINAAVTSKILDLLNVRGSKATFFLIPEYVRPDNYHILKRIYDEGHTIGLHGKSRLLAFRGRHFLCEYIDSFNKTISLVIGKKIKVRHFRPPSGWRTINLYNVLARKNIILVGWSFMCWLDVYTNDPKKIIERFKSNLSPGSIYVLHDGEASSYEPKREIVPKALAEILVLMDKHGFVSRGL